MSKELVTKLGDVEIDNLIVGTKPEARAVGIVIAAVDTATTLKRGTMLQIANEEAEYKVYTEMSDTPIVAVLADDVEVGTSGGTAAVAYKTGCFNKKVVEELTQHTFIPMEHEILNMTGIFLSKTV